MFCKIELTIKSLKHKPLLTMLIKESKTSHKPEPIDGTNAKKPLETTKKEERPGNGIKLI